jgi:hypothetical protein
MSAVYSTVNSQLFVSFSAIRVRAWPCSGIGAHGPVCAVELQSSSDAEKSFVVGCRKVKSYFSAPGRDGGPLVHFGTLTLPMQEKVAAARFFVGWMLACVDRKTANPVEKTGCGVM